MSKFSSKAFAAVGAFALSLSLTAVPATAAPAPANPVADMSSQLSSQLNVNPADFSLGRLLNLNENQAWDFRQDLQRRIEGLNNPAAEPVLSQIVDRMIEGVFPGLVARKNAEIRAAEEARVRAAEAKAEADRVAAAQAAKSARERLCPADAAVCVDIDSNRAWLQDGHGNITYDAPWISSGARNPQNATPRGTFRVEYKVLNEISREFGNAPMPYSIYFTNRGHAFHEGSPAVDSNGCIHLTHQDAVKFWQELQVGEKVYIF